MNIKELIPKGSYCYSLTKENGQKVFNPCPFWRLHIIAATSEKNQVTVKNLCTNTEMKVDRYPLYDKDCYAKKPYYRIGECTYLHVSNLDQIGFGLLWDQCKSCDINRDE